MRGPERAWSDPNKAAIAVRKLKEILGLNEKGEVTVGWGADTDNAIELISSLFRFSEGVPANIRYETAHRAVIEARKADALELSAVAARISEKQADYVRKPFIPYVLLTSLSLRARDRLPRVHLDGASISFARSAPRRFKMPDRVRRGTLHHGPPPSAYWSAWIKVKSRDAFSAGVRALQTVDLLRGIWNFRINHGTWRISMGAGDAPFNKILLGPIHTLHHSNGRPADDLIWWEPDYVQPLSPFDVDQHLVSLKRFEAQVRRGLKNSPHGGVLRDAILRYVRALDERDHSTSFLRLWSLLEDLTATSNADHSTTVRRATFLSPDPEFHRLAFDQLRRWRNRIVHEGESAQEAERMINEVKSYAEALFLLLLRHGARFKDLSEFGKFLDSPTAPTDIRRRQSHLRLALTIRR